MEQRHQPVGGLAQFFGTQPRRDPPEGRFGVRAGLMVQPPRQLLEELANDPDVVRSDLSPRLTRGRRRQPGRQWLAGQRPPWTEILGFGDAPARLGAADPQPPPQHLGQRGGAQLGGGGLGGQPGDQLVFDGGLAAPVGFQVIQHRHQFGMGQGVEVHGGQLVERGVQLAQYDGHLIRTHASNTSAAPQVVVGSLTCSPPRQR